VRLGLVVEEANDAWQEARKLGQEHYTYEVLRDKECPSRGRPAIGNAARKGRTKASAAAATG
jgi:hypothetical protein